MIISQLSGGLGNQLFQYAAGRCLAEINHTQLKLDKTFLNNDQLRNFELDAFNLDIVLAEQEEIKELSLSGNFEKFFNYLRPVSKRKYYREKYFHFDPSFLKLGSAVYLKGYFQSYKYFFPVHDIVRQFFTVKKDLVNNVSSLAAEVVNNNSVAVHIRRGDFSTDSITSAYHGIVPDTYYHNALQVLRSRIPGALFYFFSDDINWVKENMSFPTAVYVSGNLTRNHIEDLHLMSQCKHNIIANSSFSWWGAWLNNNPDKIVIAPKRWFNKGPKDTHDLIPEGWIKI